MLKKFFVYSFALILIICFYSKVSAENIKSTVISNGYYSFDLPIELKDTYVVEKFNNEIYIIEKISKKTESGGYAFGIKLFKSPKDYADMPDNKKIGELTDKKGIIYDVVLERPREIYYGEGEQVEKNYNRLYDYADKVEIKGVNGSKYFKGRGMKGEDLYREILKKYKTAITEKWDSDKKYENAGIGSLYDILSEKNKNPENIIGYTYYDVNSDGIEELIIGEISSSKSKSTIYNLYTMVNRKPKLVLSSKGKDRYFVCDDSFLCRESSLTEGNKNLEILSLDVNSTKLNLQTEYIYDINADKKNPWFISYNYDYREKISKKIYNNEIKSYRYKKFDFKPIVKYEK